MEICPDCLHACFMTPCQAVDEWTDVRACVRALFFSPGVFRSPKTLIPPKNTKKTHLAGGKKR